MTTFSSATPDLLHLEDFVQGRVFELGRHEITLEEIVAFGRQFDPQSFHVDPDAARDSPFGGLIASGWHSCAILMRLWHDAVLATSVALGSPGVDEIRWLHPVRPGDVLTGRAEVLTARPSQRRPERGTVTARMTLETGVGTTVLSFVGHCFFARRSPAPQRA